VLLVRARGRVLTTHELLDVVWRGTSVLDNTVTQRIREIREALGDEARNSRYVRTISRVGYRFVGEVTSEPRTPGAIVDPPTLNGALADDLTERFSRALIERILSELILRRRAESLTADDSLIEPNHRIEHRRHPGSAISNQGFDLAPSGTVSVELGARTTVNVSATEPMRMVSPSPSDRDPSTR
jgi:hypothetical protein